TRLLRHLLRRHLVHGRHRLGRARRGARAGDAPGRAPSARDDPGHHDSAPQRRQCREGGGSMMRRHVVLITSGEPPTPAFAAQLRYSWRILLGLTRLVAPIPAPLLPVIALSRGRQRKQLWTAEHYGSPLEKFTQAQARGLAAALKEEDPSTDWQVAVAYEFR